MGGDKIMQQKTIESCARHPVYLEAAERERKEETCGDREERCNEVRSGGKIKTVRCV